MVRRKFSQKFKEQVVKECLETGNVSIVARKHEIRANVVNRWVSLYKNGGFSIGKTGTGSTNITTDEYQQLVTENKELEKTNEQLKRTLGEQALEVSILRDLLKKANPHLRTK
ncbi:transposase [Alicyclobacillus suci]|uniref:transposase n=1 Tax=Alicyclobacillus suci TaxID=2816080 RepID=UPI001A8D339C|nr:transposase [Alicyclobacillus suci]